MSHASEPPPQHAAGLAEPGEHADRPVPSHLLARRAAMAGLTAFITINIWTGAPVLALWVGSKVVGRGTLSMAAVGVVVVVLAAIEFVLAVALTVLNNVYDELTGRPRAERRATWLRSMRGEAEGHLSQRVGITLLERIVMVNVYLAVISLLVWYVFFAGAPSPTSCPTGTSC
jgi:hypothetical protein